MLEAAARNTSFIIGCSSQGEGDHTSNSANHVELRQQNHGDQKTSNKNAMQHVATPCTSVTSVDSTWETQSWARQQEELHAHLAVDFLHLPLLFKGQNAMQKKT